MWLSRWAKAARPETGVWAGGLVCASLLFFGMHAASAADFRKLPGQVPAGASALTPTGRLPATNELWLALGLPLRDRAGLERFVAEVSDPRSPNFRHYLTCEEFTARFGPTVADYEMVKRFAETNGLAIKVQHPNRLVLEVAAPVAAIEKAFHLRLQSYRHPTEDRDFYAPDAEPAVDASLPLAFAEGLNNFFKPQPRRAGHHPRADGPRKGSSPDGNGYLFGDDFRHAYLPGSALTGAGQSVGLFEWDGSYSNAIAAYAQAAGGKRTNIVVQYVLIHGFTGQPTSAGEGEVDMDIEVVMAIAPGLSKIVVFEGNPNVNSPISILNTMAESNSVKNLSCSWGWSASYEALTNTDAVFLEMAAQGQTFFNASGDNGAFTTGSNSVNGVDNPNKVNTPSSSPYITQVGGTILNMNGAGASWNSEVVWNDGTNANGRYVGACSSGGISSYYPIPTWQASVVDMAGRGGSSVFRDTPDVAACAENIYEILGANATPDDYGGGTSAAAPLWAGFMALINEQSATRGGPSGGFINPSLYSIAASSNYLACFHDITSGSNIWKSSPNLFYAANGYDLCTGLGSMHGTNLINALSAPVPTPAFANPSRSGRQVTLTWTTLAGQTYQLQYSTNLLKTNWINLGAATNAAGAAISATDTVTNRQRFYRVLLEP